jgi:hypothetical protein
VSKCLGVNVAIDALTSVLPGWGDRGAIWAIVPDVKQLQEEIPAMVGLNLKPDVENEVKQREGYQESQRGQVELPGPQVGHDEAEAEATSDKRPEHKHSQGQPWRPDRDFDPGADAPRLDLTFEDWVQSIPIADAADKSEPPLLHDPLIRLTFEPIVRQGRLARHCR